MVDIKFYKEIDMNKPCISISDVLGMLSEPFDQKGVAEKTYNKHFNRPESEYYQKTVEEIIEMWSNKGKVSMQYGSMLDDYTECVLTNPDSLELYKLDNDIENDERLQSLVTSFDHYYETIKDKYTFVAREKTLYLDMGEFYVKGRFDALFEINENGHLKIHDWKSSGEVETKTTPWTKKLLGPGKIYNALNSVTYTIQTQFYKMALLHGYVPEDWTEDMIETTVVQLPGHICENGLDYQAHQPAIPYDEVFLTKIFNFAYKKKQLMNK